MTDALTFADILSRAKIPATDVDVMLQSPKYADLLTLLPGSVRTRRGALEAYQATHQGPARAALSHGRPWVAAFVKDGSDLRAGRSRMLFVGMYANQGGRDRSHAKVMGDPDVQRLHTNFAVYASQAQAAPDRFVRWFDLSLDDRLADLQGRLVCGVRLTPNDVRLAENLDAPIRAIRDVGSFDAAPPDWRVLTALGGYARELPPGWASRLAEWRGLYLIVDETDGARYVGAADAKHNLRGRWRAHIADDAGMTAGLTDRDPARFRFSILERTSPDLPDAKVIALKQTRMLRLHSGAHGLNAGAP